MFVFIESPKSLFTWMSWQIGVPFTSVNLQHRAPTEIKLVYAGGGRPFPIVTILTGTIVTLGGLLSYIVTRTCVVWPVGPQVASVNYITT
mgnify:CR=1 FL=1